MMFLLRMAFWLTIVFALLPGAPKSAGDNGAGHAASAPGATVAAAPQGAGVDPIEALGAATAAMSDASGFCGRQPHACAIGAQLIEAVGERAEAGARMMLSYIGTQIAEEKRKVAERALGRPATDTLTADDLGPAWQGLPPAAAAPAPAVPLPPKRPASV